MKIALAKKISANSLLAIGILVVACVHALATATTIAALARLLTRARAATLLVAADKAMVPALPMAALAALTLIGAGVTALEVIGVISLLKKNLAGIRLVRSLFFCLGVISALAGILCMVLSARLTPILQPTHATLLMANAVLAWLLFLAPARVERELSSIPASKSTKFGASTFLLSLSAFYAVGMAAATALILIAFADMSRYLTLCFRAVAFGAPVMTTLVPMAVILMNTRSVILFLIVAHLIVYMVDALLWKIRPRAAVVSTCVGLVVTFAVLPMVVALLIQRNIRAFTLLQIMPNAMTPYGVDLPVAAMRIWIFACAQAILTIAGTVIYAIFTHKKLGQNHS